MKEAGILIGGNHRPIYWHVPDARTSVSIPDDRALWNAIWENRHELTGFAHTHPGSGPPTPSLEDITTFAAIEAALGRRLGWWIATQDKLIICEWVGPGEHKYENQSVEESEFLRWLPELRIRSEM